jgi:hypothetical protein
MGGAGVSVGGVCVFLPLGVCGALCGGGFMQADLCLAGALLMGEGAVRAARAGGSSHCG